MELARRFCWLLVLTVWRDRLGCANPLQDIDFPPGGCGQRHCAQNPSGEVNEHNRDFTQVTQETVRVWCNWDNRKAASGEAAFHPGLLRVSILYPEDYVALQRAAGRGHSDVAGGRSLGNSRDQERVAPDREVCGSPVERNVAGPCESLAEDLSGLADFARIADEGHKWAKTRSAVRQNFDKAMKSRTLALGAEVFASEAEEKLVPHMCKSRACPSCGHKATIQWQQGSFPPAALTNFSAYSFRSGFAARRFLATGDAPSADAIPLLRTSALRVHR